jgi:peptidoglycan hydrolase CwlO-like protein
MVQSKDQALNPQSGDQVLRSFHEWMVQQARAAKPTNQQAQFSDLNNQASRKGSYFSPAIASREPSIGTSTSPELPIDLSQQANIPPVASNRRSVGKRVFRAAVRGILIAIVVALVWLAYRDDQTKKLTEAWGRSTVIWLSSALGVGGSVSESAAEPSTKDQATSAPAATSRTANEFVELQQRLQTVMNDLADLRRNVEQLSSKQEQRFGEISTVRATEQDVGQKTSSLVNDLAVLRHDLEQLSSKQEQMSRDIATVRATEQDVGEKLSSLTKAAPIHAPSRKNGARAVHAETARQPAPEPPPMQVSPAGTVSPTDNPPRPPLPLPMPDETLSPVH